VSRFWPTPTCNDTRPNRNLEKQGKRHTMGLAERVKTQSTLFAEDTHASPFPTPGSAEAMKMTATSGRKCIGSWLSSGPLGSLQRMLLDTSQWASTKCFLTWKARATPQGRLLFRLAPSMPRTEEIGSGLWPTMTVSSGAQIAENPTPGQTGGTTLWGAARMWPTPGATEAKSDTLNIQNRLDKGKQIQLCHAVRMWPTPLARDCRTIAGARRTENAMGTEPLVTEVAEAEGATVGALNPQWVEWLMGYPSGWTDLKDSGMPLSQPSPNSSDAP